MTATESTAAHTRSAAAPRPSQIDPHQAYTVTEAAAALSISRAQCYALMARGVIRPLMSLGHRRISGSEIIRLTSGAEESAA